MPTKDDSAWLVQDRRIEQAEAALKRVYMDFSDEEMLEIAWLVGCDDALSYTPDGQGLQYDFNDLQLIAFAAVIVSIAEVRNR